MSNALIDIEDWANTLTQEEAIKVLIDCVYQLYTTEDVRIDDDGEPYWESCGERLLDNDE